MSRQVVVNGWFWGQLATGSGQYLHAMARCLPEIAAGDAYTLILPKARFPDLPSGNLAVPPSWRGVLVATPFDPIDENLAKVWFEQIAFPRACRLASADLAFVPYWGSPGWRPCRTAVTVHDIIPLVLPAYRGGLSQRLYTKLVSWTARRADVVLTDSQASRRDIVQHLHIPEARAHAVLLAVDEQYRPVVDPEELKRVREKYELPGRFILYLGGFDVRKNVARLVRAYARFLNEPDLGGLGRPPRSNEQGLDLGGLPGPPRSNEQGLDLGGLPGPPRSNEQGLDLGGLPGPPRSDEAPFLVIAGKLPVTDTAFTPDPRRVVAEAGMTDQVQFTGWIDEADKPALYSLASLFVFPSLYEGFGLPVAEAAACGAPVLTSNRSSLPEADPGAVLVDPEDETALAVGLAQAIALPRSPAIVVRRTWQDVARETGNKLPG